MGKREKENEKIVERIDTNTGKKKKLLLQINLENLNNLLIGNKYDAITKIRYFRRKLKTAVRNIM